MLILNFYSPVFFIALLTALNLGQMLERGKTSLFLLLLL